MHRALPSTQSLGVAMIGQALRCKAEREFFRIGLKRDESPNSSHLTLYEEESPPHPDLSLNPKLTPKSVTHSVSQCDRLAGWQAVLNAQQRWPNDYCRS